ncbi:MAG: cardiolipin synthase [Clostridia bacterium]
MIKSIKKILANRVIVGGILILVQFLIVIHFLWRLHTESPLFHTSFQVISTLIVIWLARKEDNPAYKISWIILIFAFPIVGGIFYLFWGNTPLNKASMIKLHKLDRNSLNLANLPSLSEEIASIDLNYERIYNYVIHAGHFEAFPTSNCEYHKLGEEFFKSLLYNLKKAEKFIFLEYFIVENGKMWDSILEILIEKAKNGVEVRFMYDDAGCLGTLPSKYHKKLANLNINCVRFNPFRPTLQTYLNNRDHRKICVIDGEIGYMGGINLADEYINERERFGHWKDMGIVFDGEAISNLTLMFLELWEFSCDTPSLDYTKYLAKKKAPTKGYIQPFSDSPLDNYNIGENVYMQIINSAKKYVYITTPYLILDNEMITALIIASQSGVDVKIITPFVPDKKYVHPVTCSFYPQLIDAGVKIYEYTPGFMHGKVIIADDNIGVVGTINMDFRSFYMHFECGTILYDCPVLSDIKKDILDTLSVSEEISSDDFSKTPHFKRFIYSILRIFSPMM